MSIATRRGAAREKWQYSSRSDTHSKLACWTVLFDALLGCDVLREAARRGRLGFGINHVMVGPINKTLDLVVTRPGSDRDIAGRSTFASWADRLGLGLDAEDRAALDRLPPVHQDRNDEAAEVAIALEAKACMTEHVKSLPRLHAEILATGYLAKRAAPRCITVSYSLVNAAERFVSPGSSKKVNEHKQPESARRVVEMIDRAVPRVAESGAYGYDCVGVTIIECANDGSPVRVVQDPGIGPGPQHHLNYERMIKSLCSEYRARFGR